LDKADNRVTARLPRFDLNEQGMRHLGPAHWNLTAPYLYEYAISRREGELGLGRAFAVSMAMNFVGVPVGSLLGGAVLTVSVTLAFLLMALANLAGALLALSIPRHGGGSSAKGWRRRGGTSVARQDRHPSQSRPDPFLD